MSITDRTSSRRWQSADASDNSKVIVNPHSLLLLTAATWVLAALLSPGTLPADPSTRFELAQAVVSRGEITLSEAGLNTIAFAGEQYSAFFPGQTILFLPIAAVCAAVAGLGVDPALTELGGQFAISVVLMPLFAALAVVGYVLVLEGLSVSRRVALLAGAVLAAGTPLVMYAGRGSEEVILAALGIWIFLALLSARNLAASEGTIESGRVAACQFVNRIGIAGALAAVALVHRSTAIAIILGAAVFALPMMWRYRHLILKEKSRLICWTLLAAAIVCLVPLYNWMRFGNPLDTGYGRFYEQAGVGLLSTPLLKGLYGHLLSPGKSVFLYTPWLLLLPLSLVSREVYRRLGWMGIGLAVIVAVHLLIYSQFVFWSGGYTWGVRFHVSLMPLLAIPIGVWLPRCHASRVARIAVCTLAVLSTVVQLAGASLNESLEMFQHPEQYTGFLNQIPKEHAWNTTSGSQLVRRFDNIGDKFAGRTLLPGSPENAQQTGSWNIFPAVASAAMDRRAIPAALWCIWLLLLAALIVYIWRFSAHCAKISADDTN